MKFLFNQLLEDCGVDPAMTLVLRHRPQEAELRKMLPSLADEQPEVFNSYQQTQLPRTEKQMLQASYVASFIGINSGEAMFVGLYENRGSKRCTKLSRARNPYFRKLSDYGVVDLDRECQWFDLVRLKNLAEYSGKLVIDWPGEINWSRWASTSKFSVKNILAESALRNSIPVWNELVLNWIELCNLPRSWQQVISQWRGVYYIFDTKRRKGYVGAAYGRENIMGRWSNYTKSGHGNNKELRDLDPRHFRFSILQLVAHDTPPDTVMALEASWKRRLHTRDFGLNSN